MKTLFKGFIYFILLIYMLIAFAPKQQAFYKLEHFLQNYQVIINKEKLDIGWFNLAVLDFNLLFENINIAKIKSFDLQLLLVQNHIYVEDISIVDLKGFLPPKIKFIHIDHNILQAHLVDLKAQGDFGKATGQLNLYKRKLRINFQFAASFVQSYKASLRYLKRSKQGGYYYEYSF